jgi:hypothetical protein
MIHELKLAERGGIWIHVTKLLLTCNCTAAETFQRFRDKQTHKVAQTKQTKQLISGLSVKVSSEFRLLQQKF